MYQALFQELNDECASLMALTLSLTLGHYEAAFIHKSLSEIEENEKHYALLFQKLQRCGMETSSLWQLMREYQTLCVGYRHALEVIPKLAS